MNVILPTPVAQIIQPTVPPARKVCSVCGEPWEVHIAIRRASRPVLRTREELEAEITVLTCVGVLKNALNGARERR